MAYVNNLYTYTNLTTPASPYAVPPSVVCDFSWWNTATNQTFGRLLYDVDANTYPPTIDNSIPPIYEATVPWFVSNVCNTGTPVTFDCQDTQGLGLPVVVAPAGITIVDYAWDLGNGQTGQGPQTTTTYHQASPDASVTLTITDSLDRTVTTTHRLNFILALPISGQTSQSVNPATPGSPASS